MKMLKRQNGLTLTELMVGLSVMTILMGMAAPSYSEFITKRKIAGAANSISSYFEDMKMLSVKRNEFVTITYMKETDGPRWCLGAVVGNAQTCDCMAETPQCLIDSAPRILTDGDNSQFKNVLNVFETGFVTFDPVRGILADPTRAVAMNIAHATEDYRVRVSVNAAGSIRKCSPPDYKLVGYSTCI